VATSTADIKNFKILIDSTLSTEDAKMMMMDINKYCLGTPLHRYEYIQLPLKIIPDEIIVKYNLQAIAVAGWVYIEIRKGMYGLKHAGLLANQLFQQRLEPIGLVWMFLEFRFLISFLWTCCLFMGFFNVIFCFLWVFVFLGNVSMSLHFSVLPSYDTVCGSA
jgi:hypothetical protein